MSDIGRRWKLRARGHRSWVDRLLATTGTAPPGKLLRRLLTRPGRVLRRVLSVVFAPTGERASYEMWLDRRRLDPRRETDMRTQFTHWPRRFHFSLLMPVYNPPADYLRAALTSVRSQVYTNWELCVVDDASTAPHVGQILEEARNADSRIKVARLEANRGISGASNAAMALAEGEFVAPVDHDDTLAPEALYEVARKLNEEPDLDLVYTDHDMRDAAGRRFGPFFKPDWSPDLILAMNYITHFVVYRREMVLAVGGWREGLEGSQDHDMILRVTERTDRIGHVRLPLYSWVQAPSSIASVPSAKPYAHSAGMRAIRDAAARRGIEGTVEEAYDALFRYRLRRRVAGEPLVSVVALPGAGGTSAASLARNLAARTGYARYEIVEPPVGSDRVRAANEGARRASGEMLLFLSTDASPLGRDWLATLLGHAQREEVGAVGGRLLGSDGTVRHAGYVVGTTGGAVHAFWGFPADHPGYWDFARVERNCSAVSGDCLMLRRKDFLDEEGFDPAYAGDLSSVDLCLRLRERGRSIVWTPNATLRLAVSREEAGPYAAIPRSDAVRRLRERWPALFERGDPFYSPHLTRQRWDFSLAPSGRTPSDEEAR